MKTIKLTIKLAALAGAAIFASMGAQAGIAGGLHDLSAGSGNNAFSGAGSTTEICVFCHTPHGSNQSIPGAPLWNKTISPGTLSAYTSSTTEICVFCHTPHGSNQSIPGAPLWNKTISPGALTAYTSSTLDGTSVMAGSPSLACLSCHDGTQAMDVMINQPSSAKGVYEYNNAGATLGAATLTSAGGTMNTTTGFMINVLASGDLVPMLGTDLTNDHPVGIPYGGGGYDASTTTGPSVDSDFNAATYASIGGQDSWWVDTAGVGRQKN